MAEDYIEMLKAAQPEVLVLPAGLATDQIRSAVKSLKAIVLVDISSAPHIDWKDDDGDTFTQTWTDLLGSTVHYDPPQELAPVAIQSFVSTTDGFSSVEFTNEVYSCS